MSRGLGWVQHACLEVIPKYEADGEWPTTYNIAAAVYQVKRDRDGNRWVTDAQHVAVKRALEGLQRKGRVIGFRTQRQRDPGYDARAELCHHWMTEARLKAWIAEERQQVAALPDLLKLHLPSLLNMRHLIERASARIDRIQQKARAIGMKV